MAIDRSENALVTKLSEKGMKVRDDDLLSAMNKFQADFNKKMNDAHRLNKSADQRAIAARNKANLQSITNTNIANTVNNAGTTTNITNDTKVIEKATKGSVRGSVGESVAIQKAGNQPVVDGVDDMNKTLHKDLKSMNKENHSKLSKAFLQATLISNTVKWLKSYFLAGASQNTRLIHAVKNVERAVRNKRSRPLKLDTRSRLQRALDTHRQGGDFRSVAQALFGAFNRTSEDGQPPNPPGGFGASISELINTINERIRRTLGGGGGPGPDPDHSRSNIHALLTWFQHHFNNLTGNNPPSNNGNGNNRNNNNPPPAPNPNGVITDFVNHLDQLLANAFRSKFARGRSAALGAVALFGSHFQTALAAAITHPIHTIKVSLRSFRLYMQFLMHAHPGVGLITLYNLLGMKGLIVVGPIYALMKLFKVINTFGSNRARDIKGFFSKISTFFKHLGKFTYLLIGYLVSTAWNATKKGFVYLGGKIKKAAKWTMEKLAAGWTRFIQIDFKDKIKKAGKKAFKSLGEILVKSLMYGIEGAMALFAVVVPIVVAVMGAIWAALVAGVTLIASIPFIIPILIGLAVIAAVVLLGYIIWKYFGQTIMGYIHTIGEWFESASEWVSRIPDKMADAAKSIKKTIMSWGDDIATWFTDMWAAMVKKLEEGIRGVLNTFHLGWVADRMFGPQVDGNTSTPAPSTPKEQPPTSSSTDSAKTYNQQVAPQPAPESKDGNKDNVNKDDNNSIQKIEELKKAIMEGIMKNNPAGRFFQENPDLTTTLQTAK